MEFSQYLKRQERNVNLKYTTRGMDPVAAKVLGGPKYCRTCNKELDTAEKNYLFYQRFCCDFCREKYLNGGE